MTPVEKWTFINYKLMEPNILTSPFPPPFFPLIIPPIVFLIIICISFRIIIVILLQP